MRGNLLGGRYRVVKILAKGGFGQTYVAKDLHRPGNPQCVVKQLKPASTNSSFLQNARRLFQTEAETLERLGSHDQIPRLLAYFEEKQEFYLVQEFIQGHPLSNELHPGQCWSESQVCHLLQEVLSILEFVHSQGVIHRDIKPDNLIRRQQDNRLVLVDFGIVKQIQTQMLTAQGQVSLTVAVGTPDYMPTEQARGKPRPNSDIYALGIVGIQALTGLHPTQFQENADGEHVWQHQVPQVSDALASVLVKMVRYHANKRYQTAAEALQALQPLVNELGSDVVGSLPAQQPHTPQPTAFSPSPSQDDLPAATSAPQQPKSPQPTAFSLQPSQELLSSEISSAQQSKPPQPTVFSPQPFQDISPDQNIIPVAVANSSATPVNSQEASHSTKSLPELPSLVTATSTIAPQPTSFSPPEPQTLSASTSQNHRYLLVGAGITAVFISVLGVYAIYWQPRTNVREPLEQIEIAKAEGKYEECLNQATKVPQDSRLYTEAQALLQECKLTSAKQLAADGNFLVAIAEASKIPQTDASYQAAQQLIGQWSDSILDLATNKYQSGNLNDAIATAKTIPENSPIYQKAQGTIKQWNEEWQKNNSYLKAARQALNEGKWQNAISEVKKVTDTLYWKKQIEPIIQKAESKIAESKPAVTSQPTRTVTRPTTHTTPRQAARTAARTTPKRAARTVTRRRAPTTPRGVTRTVTRQPVSKTPKRRLNPSWSDLVRQTGSRR